MILTIIEAFSFKFCAEELRVYQTKKRNVDSWRAHLNVLKNSWRHPVMDPRLFSSNSRFKVESQDQRKLPLKLPKKFRYFWRKDKEKFS
jgi:hypothetical protein